MTAFISPWPKIKDWKLNKLELECNGFCHRIRFEKDEDGWLSIAITEKGLRGRPKWIDVLLWEDKVEKIRKFLK